MTTKSGFRRVKQATSIRRPHDPKGANSNPVRLHHLVLLLAPSLMANSQRARRSDSSNFRLLHKRRRPPADLLRYTHQLGTSQVHRRHCRCCSSCRLNMGRSHSRPCWRCSRIHRCGMRLACCRKSAPHCYGTVPKGKCPVRSRHDLHKPDQMWVAIRTTRLKCCRHPARNIRGSHRQAMCSTCTLHPDSCPGWNIAPTCPAPSRVGSSSHSQSERERNCSCSTQLVDRSPPCRGCRPSKDLGRYDAHSQIPPSTCQPCIDRSRHNCSDTARHKSPLA